MKFFIIMSCLLMSFQANALDGNSLSLAAEAALGEASSKIELDSVEAWESTLFTELIEVKILSHDHASGRETLLNYECGLSDSDMACREQEHGHESESLLGEGSEFEEMAIAHQAAMAKLAKTLARQNSDLSVLQAVKAWKSSEEDGGDHGHEHGGDIWTKAIYTLNEASKTTFIQCHQHQGETDYACHYKTEGVSEPDLEEGHDHDH